MERLNPVVAEVSPNIYAAAKQAKLKAAERLQLEQLSFALKEHRKLSKLGVDTAKNQFRALGKDQQESLRTLFKDSPYAQEDPSLMDYATGAVKSVVKGFASPLVSLYNAAGKYGRAINTPYLVGQQVKTGQGSVLDKKVWDRAWSGKELYNPDALKQAESTFGVTDVLVARGLLSGKKPGEIVELYGKVDSSILASLTKAYNDEAAFKQVLDATKYAQFSPGRDIARMLDDRPLSNGGLYGDYVSSKTKNISGAIDFTYQIVVDPMTWITGGTTKAATVGERLANHITDAAKQGEFRLGVEEVFAKPEVATLWNNQLGPAVRKFAEAKTTGEKTVAYRELIADNPGYRNREAVEKFAKNGLFDAPTAQKYFENIENVQLLLNGRVDGVSYYRNGVAVARKYRSMADGFTSYLDSVFNPTTAKNLGPLKSTGRSVEELDAKGEDIYTALSTAGDALDNMASPIISKVLLDAQAEIKGLKKLGLFASRSPIGLEVRLGPDAVMTAENFTTKARVILPRDLAEFMTTKFINSTEDEQVVIMRNLDAAIMFKSGLNGEPEGRMLMEKILSEKYGGQAGQGVLRNININADALAAAPLHSVRQENGVTLAQSLNTVQPYQEAKAIGSLPYAEIASMANSIKSKKNIFYAIGGSIGGETARKVTDVWSVLTLFPRLGMRSAIDEGLMYALTAPGKDLFHFAFRLGARMGKVTTAFTGSAAAVGPVSSGLKKIFGKAPQDAIDKVKRAELLKEFANNKGVSMAELTSLQKREAIGDEAMKIFGGNINPEAERFLVEALIHQPEMLNSTANSLVAQAGLSARFTQDNMASYIDFSSLTKHLNDLDLKRGSKTRSISTRDLELKDKSWLTAAHHENWYLTFVPNFKKLPGDQPARILDPGAVFFQNNGLKVGINPVTGKSNFESAMNDLSRTAGLTYDDTLKLWKVEDQIAVNAVKGMSSRSAELAQQGIDDVGIIRDSVFRMLADMQIVFHGSADGYNQKLMDAVRLEFTRYSDLEKGFGVDDAGKALPARAVNRKWATAVESIPYERFRELTDGFQPRGEINTNIDFPTFVDPEGAFRKLGNKLMEGMDRQVNGLFRQPAVMVTYFKLRESYVGLEKTFADGLYSAQIAAEPARYASKSSKKYLRKQVDAISAKRYTEIASRDAADRVLMFADNPNIRSNAAFSLRTVGRYYRATEDFQRRIFRLVKLTPRVIYRLRLVHQGLDARGEVHIDDQGDPYVVMPMDKIIFKATDTTMRVLTGDTGYSQPAFNDFTLKLKMVNPSFQQDSGMPTLAGPVAGLSVIGIKSLLGYTNNPFAKQVGERLDTIALGNIGDNIDIVRAVIPASLQKLWATLPVNEKSRQEVTAAQQAMSYMAANGYFLDVNATEFEKAAYLKNLRISAHNIVALRSFLGLIMPVAPTMQESLDIPDYLKNVGITGLRPEFFEILNKITEKNQGDITDPYELAMATFIGKNPGKLVYTVSRTDKETKILVKNTEKLKDWAIANSSLIKTYGEAAFVFAPRVGDFTSDSYAWIQAAGLVENKDLENYYRDILVAQDKQSYYNIGDSEKEILANTVDPNARARIIAQSTAARNSLKSSNPLLNSALIGEGNTIGDEQNLMSKVKQIIANPKTDINSATRARMSLAIQMVEGFVAFTKDPRLAGGGSEAKRTRRDQIDADLKELMVGDLAVTEAYRAIFKNILFTLSRDTYVTFNRRS
jgi:hypothetical protein